MLDAMVPVPESHHRYCVHFSDSESTCPPARCDRIGVGASVAADRVLRDVEGYPMYRAAAVMRQLPI